jgi:hypothetical protein
MLIFGGCAKLPETCTTVFPWTQYCIQSTEGIKAFAVLQEVEFQRNNESERFLVRLEVDQDSFRLALLTTLGQSLGSLSIAKNRKTVVASPGVEGHFDMLMPAAYVQLALWPRAVILKGLQSRSIDVQEAGGRRVFKDKNGQTIILVEYEGSAPPYDRLIMSSADGHKVIITTLERD